MHQNATIKTFIFTFHILNSSYVLARPVFSNAMKFENVSYAIINQSAINTCTQNFCPVRYNKEFKSLKEE